MNGISSFVQQIVIGLVILLTVWIDQRRNQGGFGMARAQAPARAR
jgi:ribose/xylose/arabinose/galactoside ABC-type transport system permease subunit